MDLMTLVCKIVGDSTEFDSTIDKMKGSALGAVTGVGKVLAGATLATTSAMVAFGKSAVDTGMTFDSSMSQVAATMGKTVDEISELRDFAQKMGATTVFSATEAADALNYMALAGYDADKSMQMLPNVLNLAASGSMDLARASDMVTDAESALGLKGEEVTVMIDQMAKTASTTNTSVEQLGDAILTIGGTAQSMHGGTEELAQVLGLLADNGIKGSEAGTHLRNMLMKLSAPSKEGAAWLEQLGVKIFDAEGNMRSFSEVFPELNTAMSSLTEEQRLQALSDIFNARDVASANALLGTTTERWEEVATAIDGAEGAAKKMAETQLDNLQGDITLLKSAFEGLQIAVSDTLTPIAREFVQFGSDALSKLTEGFKSGGIDGAMEVLGNLISDGLTKLVEKLPAILEAGVKLLKALGKGLVDNFPVLVDSAVEVLMMLVEELVKGAPKMLEAAVEIIFALADGLIEALPELIPAIVEVILMIVEKLTDPNMLMKLIQAAFQILSALGQGLLNAIPTLIQHVPTIILNLIEALLRFLPQMIASGGQFIIEFAAGMIGAIPKVLEAVIKLVASIGDGFKKRAKEAIDWGKDLIDNFINGIKSKFAAVGRAFTSLGNTIKSYIHFSEPDVGPLSDFSTYAPDMMKTFADGIKANEGMLRKQIASSFDFGDMIKSPNMEYGLSDGRHTSMGGVVINVYGAEGQSAIEIAEEVERILTDNELRRRASYA